MLLANFHGKDNTCTPNLNKKVPGCPFFYGLTLNEKKKRDPKKTKATPNKKK